MLGLALGLLDGLAPRCALSLALRAGYLTGWVRIEGKPVRRYLSLPGGPGCYRPRPIPLGAYAPGDMWDALPAALRLQRRPCSGPRVMLRSWSSCPRWQSMGSVMGRPQRQQMTRSPFATRCLHMRDSRSCAASYPRCCLVPRSRSFWRACSRQYVELPSTGHPGSAQGRIAIGTPARR